MNKLHDLLDKYISGLAIAGLIIICLIFFHQLLFSGEIMNATDAAGQQYFWNFFEKENLFADPCFQTWLPYINGGTPSGGGLELIFRPITLLTLLLFPVHVALNYEVVLYLLVMGIFMYFYMQEIGVSHLSAFLAALILMLNGEIVTLINAGHINKLGSISMTTLVFWAFERALRRQTLTAFLFAAFALGFQFWQGHVQISFYTCIAVGVYFLVRVGLFYRENRDFSRVAKLTWMAAVMVMVFLLLSAVEFLPLISFSQVSERAEGVSYEFATSWSMPPEEVITYLVPGFFGLRRLNHDEDENILPYWGRMPFTQTGRYFGVLPLLLTLLALCFVRNRHVLTLSIIALLALLLGMGKYIPTYQLLYDYAPGFNKFRVPQMILFLVAFATSGLAGFGAEWLFSDFSERKSKRLHVFLGGCIAIFLIVFAIAMLLPDIHQAILQTFKEALQRKDGTDEIAMNRLQNIWHGLLIFSGFFAAALGILALRLSQKIPVKWIVLAAMLVYLLDIGLFNSYFLDTVPIEGSMYINENDAIRYCKAHPGLYRIFQTTDEPETYSTFNKYIYHHLFSVSGYEAVGVHYYNEYLRRVAFGSALIDLLNIKYIIFPKDVKIDNQPAEVGKQYGPYKIVMNADAVLAENLNCLPRAFPIPNAKVLTTPDEIFAAMLQPGFNPVETVILEDALPPGFPERQGNPPSFSQSQVTMTNYATRTIRLQANMADDGFVFLSEKYYPGWKAYVNGQPAKIYKADYTFQAIFLPKGVHDVTFAFQPTQFIVGLSITIMTCCGLIGVFVFRNRLSK